MVERPNAAFAASHHGGDKEEYDAANSAVFGDGNANAWNTMLGISRSFQIPRPFRSMSIYENLRVPLEYVCVHKESGVNIGRVELGPATDSTGSLASAFLSLDDRPPDAVIERVRALDPIEFAEIIAL